MLGLQGGGLTPWCQRVSTFKRYRPRGVVAVASNRAICAGFETVE